MVHSSLLNNAFPPQERLKSRGEEEENMCSAFCLREFGFLWFPMCIELVFSVTVSKRTDCQYCLKGRQAESVYQVLKLHGHSNAITSSWVSHGRSDLFPAEMGRPCWHNCCWWGLLGQGVLGAAAATLKRPTAEACCWAAP